MHRHTSKTPTRGLGTQGQGGGKPGTCRATEVDVVVGVGRGDDHIRPQRHLLQRGKRRPCNGGFEAPQPPLDVAPTSASDDLGILDPLMASQRPVHRPPLLQPPATPEVAAARPRRPTDDRIRRTSRPANALRGPRDVGALEVSAATDVGTAALGTAVTVTIRLHPINNAVDCANSRAEGV